MEKHYGQKLEMAIEAANTGNTARAHQLFREALQEHKEEPAPVLFETALFLFKQGFYEEALNAFVQCHHYNYRKNEVEQIVLEAYHEPNMDFFQDMYYKNIQALQQYEHIRKKDFPAFDSLHLAFIPYSDVRFIIFDRKERKFLNEFHLVHKDGNVTNYTPNEIVLFKNEYCSSRLSAYEKQTADPSPYLSARLPFYLIYDELNLFAQYLQVSDFSSLLSCNRLVFLFGEDETKEWFADPQALFPVHYFNISGSNDPCIQLVTSIQQAKLNNINQTYREMMNYYQQSMDSERLERIRSGKPRILFWTSRFSTFIQYCIRDCMDACRKLDIPSHLLIEKSDIHRITDFDQIEAFHTFKPDIVFMIDHFRWEINNLPGNIPFITWVQDELPHIFSADSAQKLGKWDFVLTQTAGMLEELEKLGYSRNQMVHISVPANESVYKNYSLTADEKSQLSADICYVSHPGNAEAAFMGLVHSLKSQIPNASTLEKALRSVYKKVYQLIDESQPVLTYEHYKAVIIDVFRRHKLSMSDEFLDMLAKRFRFEVGMRLHRSIPLEWLAERGYNMKIWGGEWVTHPTLSKYAMGPAGNGEHLAKIYNASKIVLGLHFHYTTHQRAFEAILSHGFYLSKSLDERFDWDNLRNHLQEDKEVVFFYNKEDLYRKVDYYLEHEEKRNEIMEHSIKAVLEKFTYTATMKKIIAKLSSYLEETL